MAYWTDIFTLETWAQAAQNDYRVSGFPAPTKKRGGYSTQTFQRVKPGDVLLCYCKSPAQRWVGALRVTGEAFRGNEPVWGLDETGEVRYPWRFPVEPIITLDPQRGAPGAEVATTLDVLKRLRRWGGFLQRSLNSVPDVDGERLLRILEAPREPEAIATPTTRRTRRRDPTAPERSHLEAQAQPFSLAPADSDDVAEPEPEGRTHTEIQGKLRDIGIYEGYDVWVADRGTLWRGEPLGKACLADLPIVAAERTRSVMKNIDVIWFRAGAGHPVRFFEVEHSTTVYSGLLRFNDVMIDFPVAEAFIVGDGERTLRKFEREISRRTFEHSGLISVTKFLNYEVVRETWQRYKGVGAGSRTWGSIPGGPPSEQANRSA